MIPLRSVRYLLLACGLSLQLSIAQTPQILNVTPASGRINTIVTVSGAGFSSTPSQNIVSLGPIGASVLTSTPTDLTFRIPPGSWAAPLSVTTNGCSATTPFWFKPLVPSVRLLDSAAFLLRRTIPSVGYTPTAVEFADIDGDQISDFIVCNRNSSSFTVFRTVPFGQSINDYFFSTDVDQVVGFFPTDLKTSDIDGDGKLDIVTTHQFTATVQVWRNASTLGSAAVASGGSFPTEASFKTIAIADFDLDGRTDIAVAARDSNVVTVLRNQSALGSPSLVSTGVRHTLSRPIRIRVEDLDGDGRKDLVLASEAGGGLYAMINTTSTGAIAFGPPFRFAQIDSLTDVQVADLDGDNKPDVLAISGPDSTLHVLQNNSVPGNVNFLPIAALAAPTMPVALSIGDLNADGKLDAVVASQSGRIMLYQNVDGVPVTLIGREIAPAGTETFAIAIGDLTRDSKPELCATGFVDGSLRLLQNTLPGATEVDLKTGWNLVSVPRTPETYLAAELFPGKTGALYGFSGQTYASRSTLALGEGYWVYYLSPTLNAIAGAGLTETSFIIPAADRWYLIGSVTKPILPSELVSDPPGIFIATSVFQFANGVYSAPPTIEPGFGYWVYARQAGRIIIRSN